MNADYEPSLDQPTPADTAETAAEAIRSLNHSTQGVGDQGALEYPAQVYGIIASLKVMAGRLPQLFDQLSAWLEHEQAAGRVGHDSGNAADSYVATVTEALTLANMEAT